MSSGSARSTDPLRKTEEPQNGSKLLAEVQTVEIPFFLRETVEFAKSTSAAEAVILLRGAMGRVVKLASDLESKNSKLVESLAPHVARSYIRQGRNILLEESLLDIAISTTADPEIAANAPLIRNWAKRLRTGFNNSPAHDNVVPRNGFWKSLEEAQVPLEETKPLRTGHSATVPPSNLPFYKTRAAWKSLNQKVLDLVRKQEWRVVDPRTNSVEAAVVFGVFQKNKTMPRPCCDLRKRNAAFQVEEKCRMISTKQVNALYSLLMGGGNIHEMTTKKEFSKSVEAEKSLRDALASAVTGGTRIPPSSKLPLNPTSPPASFEYVTPNDDVIGVTKHNVERDFIPAPFLQDLKSYYFQFVVRFPHLNRFWMPLEESMVPWYQTLTGGRVLARTVKDPNSDRERAGGMRETVVHYACLETEASAFGAIESVHECIGGSEALMLIFNVVLKILCTIYVDDIKGLPRPGAAAASAFVVSATLALLGKGESFEKFEQVSVAREKVLQSALVHLGLSYSFNYTSNSMTIRVPEKKLENIREQLKIIMRRIFRADEETIEPCEQVLFTRPPAQQATHEGTVLPAFGQRGPGGGKSSCEAVVK